MSVNAYRPHVIVLPEDDANREMAIGFFQAVQNDRAYQIMPVAGGWLKTMEKFSQDYAASMHKYPERRVVLLVDFDDDVEDRRQYFKSHIPTEIKGRVFVLGVASEPEQLKKATGKTFETIGKTLAQDCAGRTQDHWSHALLQHNQAELQRLFQDVQPILF